jgi:hypothetical protein
MRMHATVVRSALAILLSAFLASCGGEEPGAMDPGDPAGVSGDDGIDMSSEAATAADKVVPATDPSQCNANQHLCSNLGGCASNNSVKHCGRACIPCTTFPHVTTTCEARGDAHVCTNKCKKGFKVCDGFCIANNKPCG